MHLQTLLLPLLVCSVTLQAAPQIKVVLVGDSTVQAKSGWGPAFLKHLQPGVEGFDDAKGGRSSKSFYEEGLWKIALDRHPTFILIQFGHNDQPGKGPQRETDPETTYAANLVRYITEARAAGAQPILITPVTRRTFEADGRTLTNPHLQEYAAAVRRVGVEQQIPVIDLFARSVALVEKLGPEGSKPFNADERRSAAGAHDDLTHLSAEGAEAMAALVVEELRRLNSELAKCLGS